MVARRLVTRTATTGRPILELDTPETSPPARTSPWSSSTRRCRSVALRPCTSKPWPRSSRRRSRADGDELLAPLAAGRRTRLDRCRRHAPGAVPPLSRHRLGDLCPGPWRPADRGQPRRPTLRPFYRHFNRRISATPLKNRKTCFMVGNSPSSLQDRLVLGVWWTHSPVRRVRLPFKA